LPDIFNLLFTNALKQRGSAEYSSEIPKILDDREFPIKEATVNESIDMLALSELDRPVFRYIMQYSSGPHGSIALNNRFVKKMAKDVINSIHSIIEPPSKRDVMTSQIPGLRFKGW
jgi:hypothetical protein